MKSTFLVCFFFLLSIFSLSACQWIGSFEILSPATQGTSTLTIIPSKNIIPTPYPCVEQKGHIDLYTFPSTLLNSEFHLRVYVPACYGFDNDSLYPVLYLLHGQSFTDDQWERLGAIDLSEQLIHDRMRSPFLIVMPFEEEFLQITEESKYVQMLHEEVIPWVEVNFKACQEKNCRSIAGISRGAGWAIRLGLSHPELFESIATHSLAISNLEAKQLSAGLQGISLNTLPRIWMDAGRSDIFLPETRNFEEMLTENQVPHDFFIFGGYHDESYWQDHMEEYISWSTLAWK
jgi:enterochelin esterase-like enzyme